MRAHEWSVKLPVSEFVLFLDYWKFENWNTEYNSFEEFLHDSIIFEETKEGFEYWNEISKRL